MATLSNSPRETITIEVETRKSFSFGLWLREDSGKPVDISDHTFRLTISQVDRAGTPTLVLQKLSDHIQASQGNTRFNLQAGHLNIKPGSYRYSITMVAAGYSAVIAKGDFKVVANVETSSIASTYATANPPQSLAVVLKKQADLHIELSTQYPPNMFSIPAGGTTGQTLVRTSNDNYELVWGTLSGGLSADGIDNGYIPVAQGDGSWEWAQVVGVDDLDALIEQLQNYADASAQDAQDQSQNYTDGQLNPVFQDINDALAAAVTAQAQAVAANNAANQAVIDAGQATIIANNRSTVLYRDLVPPAQYQNDLTLWIDTTDGRNTPKRWNGSQWIAVQDQAALRAAEVAADALDLAGSKSNTYVQSAPPVAGMSIGDLWIDSDTALLYRYDGIQWVNIVSEARLAAIADGLVTLYYQASPPTGIPEGTLWLDSLDKKIYERVGTAWQRTDTTQSPIASLIISLSGPADQSDGRVRFYAQNTAPGGMTVTDVGDLWVDSGNDLHRYNGIGWVNVEHSALAVVYSAAYAAQETARFKSTILYQTDTPASIYENEFTLWVDLTDGLNVQKRWNGSAWEAILDPGSLVEDGLNSLEIVNIPSKVMNVVATPEGYWPEDGVTPRARVYLTWTPVTLNTDGDPITPRVYEVWSRSDPIQPFQLVHSASAPLATIEDLPIYSSWEFQVRALRDESSGRGAFSDSVTVTDLQPSDEAPPTPSAPIVSPIGRGLLNVTWDGNDSTGVEMPPHVRFVYILLGLTGSEIWNRQGVVLTAGSGVTIPLTVGERYDVLFVAVNGVGLQSEESAITTSGHISGIDGADIMANSIQANSINAGAAFVDLIQGISGDLDLSANDSITLTVGAAVDPLQNEIDVVRGDVDIQQSTFRVTSTGAEVSRPGSAIKQVTENERIAFVTTTDERTLSEWTPLGLVVPIINLEEVNFGNHRVYQRGSNETVVKAV